MTEFQRDKCFTFFGTFETMLMEIGEVEGETTELKCRRALSQYALHGETSADKKINMLLMGIYPTIDYSQDRRADGFKGGRPREYSREEISRMRREGKKLNEIRQETGASRSTVKRALKHYDKDNEYDKDNDSDTERDADVYNALESDHKNKPENDYENNTKPKDEPNIDSDYDIDYDNESEYENDTEYDIDNDSMLMDPYGPLRDREYESIMRNTPY